MTLKRPRLFRGFGIFEYLLVLSPIADVFVGIGKHNDIALLSMMGPVHKIALLTLIVMAVFKLKSLKKWQSWVFISSIFACLMHIIYILLAHGAGDIGDNLNTTIRFWFFPIVAIGILILYGNSDISEKWHRVLVILAIAYSLLLLIPTAMGINNAAYAEWLEKVGSAGLFYEANEIGIICGLLGSYLIMYYFLRRSALSMLVIATLAIAAGLATGTKAALVYLVVALVFVALNNLLRLRRMSINIVGSVIIAIAIVLAAQGVISNIAGSYDRQVVENSGSFSDLIFNGRDRLLVNSLDQFGNEYSTLDRLLGGSSIESNGVAKKETEMDFADILFNFGIVGLAIYVINVTLIVMHVLARRRMEKVSIEKICFFTGLGAAAIMGHTLSSPSVGLVLAIFVGIIMSRYHTRSAHE